MEKFNLVAALAGKKVITGEGEEVSQLTYFKGTRARYCLVGVVDGCIDSWTVDGRPNLHTGWPEGEPVLFMAPQHEFKLGDEVQIVTPLNSYVHVKGVITLIQTSIDSDTQYKVTFRNLLGDNRLCTLWFGGKELTPAA